MGNVDEELLYAIRAMEVLLQSGVGIVEAMKHVADEDYGDLSVEFGRIFKAIDAGAGMSEAVRKLDSMTLGELHTITPAPIQQALGAQAIRRLECDEPAVRVSPCDVRKKLFATEGAPTVHERVAPPPTQVERGDDFM